MPTQAAQHAETPVTRRRLLAFVGWGSFATFWGSIVLATARFFFPRILYEPSPIFQAGKPGDYQVGELTTHFKAAQRVWMIRKANGLYAFIAIFTYLRRTPNWFASYAP